MQTHQEQHRTLVQFLGSSNAMPLVLPLFQNCGQISICDVLYQQTQKDWTNHRSMYQLIQPQNNLLFRPVNSMTIKLNKFHNDEFLKQKKGSVPQSYFKIPKHKYTGPPYTHILSLYQALAIPKLKPRMFGRFSPRHSQNQQFLQGL